MRIGGVAVTDDGAFVTHSYSFDVPRMLLSLAVIIAVALLIRYAVRRRHSR
jgi:hypothetical protein